MQKRHTTQSDKTTCSSACCRRLDNFFTGQPLSSANVEARTCDLSADDLTHESATWAVRLLACGFQASHPVQPASSEELDSFSCTLAHRALLVEKRDNRTAPVAGSNHVSTLSPATASDARLEPGLSLAARLDRLAKDTASRPPLSALSCSSPSSSLAVWSEWRCPAYLVIPTSGIQGRSSLMIGLYRLWMCVGLACVPVGAIWIVTLIWELGWKL